MNNYKLLKDKHQQKVNEFPMFFAFDNSQFKRGMENLGLKESDVDKIYSIGAGGYIRKSDSNLLDELFKENELEMKKAIENDLSGEGFIYEMFRYELNNHEYGYTFDLSDTLDALDYTIDDIRGDERLLKGLNKAIKEIKEYE